MGESEVEEAGRGAEAEPAALSFDRINELFTEFLMAVACPVGQAQDDARNLSRRLRAHLESDPSGWPVVKAAYPSYDLPNVHLALERWFAADSRSQVTECLSWL